MNQFELEEELRSQAPTNGMLDHGDDRARDESNNATDNGQVNALNTLIAQRTSTIGKPSLEPEALYGLAGQFVRTIEPHSEADPVAILITFLVSFGNLIGRCAYFTVEETRQFLNLFAVLVGLSSKGRKGLSTSTTGYIFSCVDEEWSKHRKRSGLSSGEGLINEVRDERYEERPIKEHGRVAGYEHVRVDEGVSDKRLLVLEQEFSQGLKTMTREGNILSMTLRQAWDGDTLSPMTKHSPIRATGAHVSVIGHITREELLRHLTETEQCNGYANRFLWFVVERSKRISNPTGTPKEALDPLIDCLCEASTFAGTESQRRTRGLPAASSPVWRKAVMPKRKTTTVKEHGSVTPREIELLRNALHEGFPWMCHRVDNQYRQSGLPPRLDILLSYLTGVGCRSIFGSGYGHPARQLS